MSLYTHCGVATTGGLIKAVIAECRSAVSSATDTTFNALVSSDADFDYFCDI